MEDVQDKITFRQRIDSLDDLLPDVEPVDWKVQLLEYIAELVENAYIAGANGVNISAKYKGTFEMKDTGPYLVAARNYVKDKGLRL